MKTEEIPYIFFIWLSYLMIIGYSMFMFHLSYQFDTNISFNLFNTFLLYCLIMFNQQNIRISERKFGDNNEKY